VITDLLLGDPISKLSSAATPLLNSTQVNAFVKNGDGTNLSDVCSILDFWYRRDGGWAYLPRSCEFELTGWPLRNSNIDHSDVRTLREFETRPRFFP
jgi:hypothetical protein